MGLETLTNAIVLKDGACIPLVGVAIFSLLPTPYPRPNGAWSFANDKMTNDNSEIGVDLCLHKLVVEVVTATFAMK